MIPGAKGITAEPEPGSGTAHLGDQTWRDYMLKYFFDRQARQEKAGVVRSSNANALT